MSTVVRFPEASSIAIHAMIFMALTDKTVITQREIAEAFAISEHHLAKVMGQLRRTGLITSVRGPSGGFRLNVKPAETSLLAIHESIVGRETVRTCLFGRPSCQSQCPLGEFIHNLDSQLLEFLANTNLSTIIEAGIVLTPPAKTPTVSARLVPR